MGLFESLFGNKKQVEQQAGQTSFQLLSDSTSYFSNTVTSLYNNDTIRSCIHNIASHVGRLKPHHIRRVNGEIIKTNSNLEWTLQYKPNRYMNAYDFYYKVATRLLLDNNAFIYINYLGKDNYEFFPINYSCLELLDYQSELYCKFWFYTGKMLIVPYAELIHLRRHFSDNDFFGHSQSAVLESLLNVTTTIDEGIIATIKNSVRLRGILKFSNSMLKEENIKAQRDAFVADFMSTDNSGGIAATDSKGEYTPIDPPSNESIIDASLQLYQKTRVYDYFGINEKILQSSAAPADYQTFYENTIEPISLQLSLEMTNKIFSDGELNYGNEITFSANRLGFSDLTTKISMARELIPLGLVTLNEMREVFNLEAIEGGDIRLQSLNYANTNIVNEYQMNKSKVNEGNTTNTSGGVEPDAEDTEIQ